MQSTPKNETPSTAAIIIAAAREAASIREGLRKQLDKQFEALRGQFARTGAPVNVMDVVDVIITDFKAALVSGKSNSQSVIFDRPYAESTRDQMLPNAEQAATLLVTAGFNAEAIGDLKFDNALDTNFHRIVVNIGLR